MDAYSIYNQIKINPLDAPKTTFITDTAHYYNGVMPFGLKNARATYQRLMDKVFIDHLGKHIEIYMDDMVVISNETPHHEDLLEIFEA